MQPGILIILALLLMAPAMSAGTEYQPVWATCIGGSTNLDIGSAVVQAPDGGFIVTGLAYSLDGDFEGTSHRPGGDAYLAKITPSGAIQWITCIGGSDAEHGWAIQNTGDGGWIIAGTTHSNDYDFLTAGYQGNNDAFLAKVRSDRALEWVRCIGGSGNDEGFSVHQNSDGTYILTGYSWSTNGSFTGAGNHGGGDAFLAKVNRTGTVLWVRCIGGSGYESGQSVVQAPDGGYLVVGTTWSDDGNMTGTGFHGISDVLVAKMRSTGSLEWVRCIGGSSNDNGYSIVTAGDGDSLLAGWTTSPDGNFTGAGYHQVFGAPTDGFAARLNATGSIEWIRCIGGTSDDTVTIIRKTSDGGYVVAGSTQSTDGNFTGTGYHGYGDAFMAGLSPSGILEWSRYVGGSVGEGATGITAAAEGGFAMVGQTYSDDGDFEGAGYHDSGDAFMVRLMPPSAVRGVFRPSAWNNWILDRAMDETTDIRDHFGGAADTPVLGDFSNDGVPDRAVFRNGEWIIDHSIDRSIDQRDHYGQAGDIPLAGHLNGDLKTDRAVFRNGQWIFDYGFDGTTDARDSFGTTGDIPLTGDFNNDGIPDRAVFRKSTWNNWIIDYNMDRSVDSRDHYGGAGDIPVVGDFNRDGVTDRAVFRAGEWIIDYNMDRSVNSRPRYGQAGDRPLVWTG